jgi:hypothetical protein
MSRIYTLKGIFIIPMPSRSKIKIQFSIYPGKKKCFLIYSMINVQHATAVCASGFGYK